MEHHIYEMRVLWLAVVVLGVAALAILAATGPLMSRIEKPDYKVERSDGAIELRAYPPLTVATTKVSGERGSAINRGFRSLADYIFGANDGAKKIEMTAPVMQSRSSATAGAPIEGKGEWTVRFVMPREWSKESLPAPRDQRVTIETLPAAKFAAIRFSGFWRDALLREKTSELEAFIARNRLARRGEPIYAFYNPPWTLPFFRRNEVMIEVAR